MKRWTLRISPQRAALCGLLILCLGAVTTVAVAWAFAWLYRMEEYNLVAEGMVSEEGSGWRLSMYDEIGSRLVFAWFQHRPRDDAPLALEPRSEVPDTLLEDTGNYRDRYHQKRGWPFLALSCEGFVETDGYYDDPVDRIRFGIAVPPLRPCNSIINAPADQRFIALPLRPVWPGFMLNTLIFAAMWFLVLSFRAAVRRSPERITRRAIIGCVSITLVLGILTTIATSWLCALCVNESFREGGEKDGFGSDGYPDDPFGRWLLLVDQEPGALRASSFIFLGGGGSGGGPNANTHDLCPSWAHFIRPPVAWLSINDEGRYTYGSSLPGKADPDAERARNEMEQWDRLLDARGWPMLAMWSGIKLREIWPENGGSVEVEPVEVVHGILLERRFNGNFRQDWSRLLPLAPIWRGFAVNVLFYTALWLSLTLIVVGVRPLRASRRIRQGRCTQCGYNLRGNPEQGCPECGWGREQ